MFKMALLICLTSVSPISFSQEITDEQDFVDFMEMTFDVEEGLSAEEHLAYFEDIVINDFDYTDFDDTELTVIHRVKNLITMNTIALLQDEMGVDSNCFISEKVFTCIVHATIPSGQYDAIYKFDDQGNFTDVLEEVFNF